MKHHKLLLLIPKVSMALSRSLFVFQRLSDIKHLSSTFWLLTFCLMFFYVGILPFMSDARLGKIFHILLF